MRSSQYPSFNKDSERSYPPLVLLDVFETQIYSFSFNLKWIMFVLFCNLLAFFVITFYMCLHVEPSWSLYAIEYFCLIMSLIDLISGFVYVHINKETQHHCYPYMSKAYGISMFCLLIAALATTCIEKTTTLLIWLHISFTMGRNVVKQIQALWFFLHSGQSLSLMHQSILTILIMTMALVMQLFLALWHALCPNCLYDPISTNPHKNIEITTLNTFLYGFFFTLSGITNIGYVGAVITDAYVQILVIIFSFLFSTLFRGGAYTNLTMLGIHKFSLHDLCQRQSYLIRKQLQQNKEKYPENFCRSVEHMVIKYLPKFISRKSPVLLNVIPRGVKLEMWMNIYRMILRHCYIFQDMPITLFHELVAVMRTESHSMGGKLYDAHTVIDKMIFIVEGSVTVMAADDDDNPMITLTVGSCIGTSFLFYPRKPKVSLYAFTFCTIHYITYKDFWRTMALLRINLTPSDFHVHELIQEKFQMAKLDLAFRKKFKLPPLTVAELKANLPKQQYVWSLHRDIKLKGTYFVMLPNQRFQDHIFLKTSWVVRFRPGSHLLKYWAIYNIVLILAVMSLFPIFMAFGGSSFDYPNVFLAFQVLVMFSFALDVFIESTTGILSEHGYELDLMMIFKHKIKTWTYILDIFVAIPIAFTLQLLATGGYLKMNASIYHLFQLQNIMKCLKLPRFFQIWNKNAETKQTVKLLINFLYSVYLWTSVYCSLFYLDTTKTWLSAAPEEANASFAHKMIILYSYILSISTLGNSFAFDNINQTCFVITLLLFSISYHIYLLSSITSSMIKTCKQNSGYYYRMHLIKKYLHSFKVPQNTQTRVKDFLQLQWDYYSAETEEETFAYMTDNIVSQAKYKRFYDILRKQVIFSNLNRRLIEDIALKCTTMLSAPDHIIVPEGEQIEHLYIIEKGHCQINTPTGEPEILNPGRMFCLMEMLLKKRSHFTYKAVTHTIVIRIRKTDIDDILRKWDSPLKPAMEQIVTELKSTLLPARVFHKQFDFGEEHFTYTEQPSWKVFSRIKKHQSCIEYQMPFNKSYKMRICKYLLMRRTILPRGKFIQKYEVFFSVILIIMIISHQLMLILREISYFWNVLYIVLLLVSFVDIYLRLHMSFYNVEGILVTHPMYTATNYLTTSFVVDFIAMIPFDIYLHSSIYQDNILRILSNHHTIKCWLCYKKLLYLYRYKGFEKIRCNTLQLSSVLQISLSLIPLLMVGLNGLIMQYIYWNLQIDPRADRIEQSSWHFDHYSKQYPNVINLKDLYCNAFYWVIMTTLGNISLPLDTLPWRQEEIFLILTCSLLGYFVLMKILAICVTIYNRQNNLVLNNYLKAAELRTYMKKLRLKNRVIKWIIAHFEYNWNETHGVQTSLIANCHSALRSTCMIQIYSSLFSTTSIFKPYTSELTRALGPKLKRIVFQKNEIIIDLNDVTSKIFIVYSGEVLVMNVTNTIQDILPPGSVFGNIDDCTMTRSMLLYMSKNSVHLLEMKATEFYEKVKRIGSLKIDLNQHITYTNLSYIKNIQSTKDKETLKVLILNFVSTDMNWKKTRIKFIIPTRWIIELISFASAYWVAYMFAFYKQDFMHLTLFYIFDFIFILKCITHVLYKSFHMQIPNKKVLKWYLHHHFTLDLLAIIPFELIIVILSDFIDPKWTNLFRLNRILRIAHFLMFMSDMYTSLSIDIFVMNILSCISKVTLFVHLCSCTLYVLACPYGVCRESSWVFQILGNAGEGYKNHYLCSVFYATCIFTQAGFTRWYPQQAEDRLTYAMISLLGRFLQFIAIGQIFMSIKYFTHNCLIYNNKYEEFKKYLKFTTITPLAKDMICGYLKNLYTHQRGNQIPSLLKHLPSYMQVAIKILAYGHNIYDNVIFNGCHHDFLRQMTGYARIQVYFAGDTICHAGEINGTMYFIQKGIVEALECDNDQTKETVIDVLSQEDTFGVVQGLFKNKPHKFTFKAKNLTTLVILQKHEWEHLLSFFPASSYEIYSKFTVEN